MSNKNHKYWYRFIDNNKVFDYKNLTSAVNWATSKIKHSMSGEIRIFRVCKKGNATELDCVSRVVKNRPDPEKFIKYSDIEEVVHFPATKGSVTVSWRDIDVYREYKCSSTS
jgi:hypothetical protein